ncbi:MAG: hypothetical protein V3W44_04325 [Dehalococcoidales bacterium]
MSTVTVPNPPITAMELSGTENHTLGLRCGCFDCQMDNLDAHKKAKQENMKKEIEELKAVDPNEVKE